MENEFTDPIVRCHDCGKLVHRVYIANEGGCNHCGNRRFKNVMAISEADMKKIVDGDYDFGIKLNYWYPVSQDFLELFSNDEALFARLEAEEKAKLDAEIAERIVNGDEEEDD